MAEGPSLRELSVRAEGLAQKHRAWQVTETYVVWAYVEGEQGAAALALRVACRRMSAPLAQPQPTPPEWRAGVREALAAAAVDDLVGPRELLSFARALSAPQTLLVELEAWLAARDAPAASMAPARAAEPVAEPRSAVSWQRFELDDGDRAGVAFVEITRQQAKVFERSGREGGERVEVVIRELKSEAAAARSVQRRGATLAREEYQDVGVVELPLPAASSQEERARAKNELCGERAARVAGFDQQLLAFFESWQARGYDPLASFQQEGQRRQEDWNAIAGACVALGAASFAVHFSRRTVVDEEHGTRSALRERELASFYRSPAKVADIALAKIRGELRDTDGGFPDWQSSTKQAALADADLDPRVTGVVARWRDRLSHRT